MTSEEWASAAVVGLLIGCLAATSTLPAAPIVAGRSLGAQLAPLEFEVGAEPNRADALLALVNAYLQRGASGLAQAAIDRAPARVRALPQIADARARALTALGLPAVALEVEQGLLARCSKQLCSCPWVGRAELRSRWLSELMRLGVTDPDAQPALAMLAYQRSVIEVRVDVR